MTKKPREILAIDPGTTCGWANIQANGAIVSGVWNFKTNRHSGGGVRFLQFRRQFEDALDDIQRDLVAYEEVRRHVGTCAAHVYGGIVALLTSICEERGIPYEGFPVGTIKKHATGKGNAGKADMIAAAYKKWPGISIRDDNQADALHIADLALSVLG